MLKRDHLVRAAVTSLSLAGMLAAPALAAAQDPQSVAPQPSGTYADRAYAEQQQGQGAGPVGNYSAPPQPPTGYSRGAPMRPQDREYARAYARWEQDRWAYDYAHCVRKHQTGALIGTLVGGIAGAVLGSNAAPRWDRSGGAIAGGALGAVAGGAVGSAAGPVCPAGYAFPPGYVPAYYGPAPYYGPAFYGPSVIVGGPVIAYRYGPRWGWRHGYWRRW